jgi:menaquinone-dependent protoporphyrinogen oxidase
MTPARTLNRLRQPRIAMPTILIVYGSTEGQTRKIAGFMADEARQSGFDVLVSSIEDVPHDFVNPPPDAVIVAASVHVGKHTPAPAQFVGEHGDLLEDVPTAFLSVSLSAVGDKQTDADGYLTAFLEETGWQPALRGITGGALRYSQYGFLKRQLMKSIARASGLPTDTTYDYEYTDWEMVRGFTHELLAHAGEPVQA